MNDLSVILMNVSIYIQSVYPYKICHIRKVIVYIHINTRELGTLSACVSAKISPALLSCATPPPPQTYSLHISYYTHTLFVCEQLHILSRYYTSQKYLHLFD